jgi:hypothetical protein
MDVEEKVTLTQRRALSGVDKLDRSKLVGGGEDGALASEGGKGSPAKIVIWVLIIIVLAAAAYLGLRTYLNKGTDTTAQTTPTPTVEPTADPADKILAAETLDDTAATGLQADSKFIASDQAVGDASESAYIIKSLLIQPYTTFVRVQYVVQSDGDKPFPQTTAVYASTLKTIDLTMNNVTTDQSQLNVGDVANIPSSVIMSVEHKDGGANKATYSFKLTQDPRFVLHTITSTDGSSNMVVLDIKPAVAASPTPSVSTTVSLTPTPSGSVSTTPTPTATGSTGLTNNYSNTDQSISSDVTDNSINLTKYHYGDSTSTFSYYLTLTGGDKPYPNVSAKYESTKITVTINNLKWDGIVGNGGSGSTDFAAKGIRDVKKVTITNSNHISIYTFELSKPIQYKLYIDETSKQLKLDFKH